MNCKQENCKAKAMKGSGSEFCYFHDPEFADKRKEDQAKGGRRGRGLYQNIGDPTLENLKIILWNTLGELRHSKADITSRARAIASVSSVMIQVISQSCIEMRLEALERAFNEGRNNDYLVEKEFDNEYDNEKIRKA